jgi:hypothetical protein
MTSANQFWKRPTTLPNLPTSQLDQRERISRRSELKAKHHTKFSVVQIHCGFRYSISASPYFLRQSLPFSALIVTTPQLRRHALVAWSGPTKLTNEHPRKIGAAIQSVDVDLNMKVYKC